MKTSNVLFQYIRVNSIFILVITNCAPQDENTRRNTSIYVMGGKLSFISYSNIVYKIHADQGIIETSTISSKYGGITNAGALNNGQIIFAIPEYSGFSKFHGFAKYNPLTKTVNEMKQLPISNIVQWSTVVNGTKFVICGSNSYLPFGHSQCFVYNTIDNTIRRVQFNFQKGSGCTVDYGDGKHMLWIGGWSASVIKLNVEDMTHTIVTSMNDSFFEVTSRTGHSCDVLGNEVVFCGGWMGGKVISDCWTLSLLDLQFGTFPNMLSKRSFFQLVNYGAKLMAIGGEGFDDGLLSTIEVYDGYKWYKHRQLALSQPLFHMAVAVFKPSQPTVPYIETGASNCSEPFYDRETMNLDIIDDIALFLCKDDFLFSDKTISRELECISGKWEGSYETHCLKIK